ncbi:hypothetical protein Tco_0066748 [Tanacetum coccineum]
MRTRSQSRNLHHQQQQAPPPVVEPFNLEEPIENPAPPLAPMDDTRTMAQLLEAPTEGYEDAIVVPEITVDNLIGAPDLSRKKKPPRSIEDVGSRRCSYNRIRPGHREMVDIYPWTTFERVTFHKRLLAANFNQGPETILEKKERPTDVAKTYSDQVLSVLGKPRGS